MKKLLTFLFPFLLLTFFVVSCGNFLNKQSNSTITDQLKGSNTTEKAQLNADTSRCYVLSQTDSIIRFDKISNYTDTAEIAYTMPYDGRIDLFSEDQLIYYRREIKTEIIVDSQLVEGITNQTIGFVDTILQKLYMGIKLNIENNSIHKDLSKIVTFDTLNTESIVINLDTLGYIDKTKELHIYLFEHSEFFNTSNAFAMSSGGHKFIFGNKDLFKSSLLFVHELGHAYGLSHYNKLGKACNEEDTLVPFMNIMHESYIGCAVLFSPQQCLLMSNGEFMDNDSVTLNLFPLKANPDTCLCDTSHYHTEFQKFLYSKDRSIHEEPVVGQYDLLNLESFHDERANASFKKNFKQASQFLFESENDRTAFVNQSMEGLKNLRKDNFIRLFGENMIRKGKRDSVDWKSFFTDGIDGYFEFYKDSIRVNPLMSTSNCKQDSLTKVVEGRDSIIAAVEAERNYWKEKYIYTKSQLDKCESDLNECNTQLNVCENQLLACNVQRVQCINLKDTCLNDLRNCEIKIAECKNCDQAAEIIRFQLEIHFLFLSNEALIDDFINTFKSSCKLEG